MAVPFSNTKLRVPKGFQNVLEGLAREVLRCQPENIYSFSAAYFEELLRKRQETGYDDIALLGAKMEDRFYNNHSFKNPNVNTNNDEQQSAAVVIQSEFRRFAAKKEVDSIKEEEAATVIQASFRGHTERQTQRTKGNEDGTPEETEANLNNVLESEQNEDAQDVDINEETLGDKEILYINEEGEELDVEVKEEQDVEVKEEQDVEVKEEQEIIQDEEKHDGETLVHSEDVVVISSQTSTKAEEVHEAVQTPMGTPIGDTETIKEDVEEQVDVEVVAVITESVEVDVAVIPIPDDIEKESAIEPLADEQIVTEEEQQQIEGGPLSAGEQPDFEQPEDNLATDNIEESVDLFEEIVQEAEEIEATERTEDIEEVNEDATAREVEDVGELTDVMVEEKVEEEEIVEKEEDNLGGEEVGDVGNVTVEMEMEIEIEVAPAENGEEVVELVVESNEEMVAELAEGDQSEAVPDENGDETARDAGEVEQQQQPPALMEDAAAAAAADEAEMKGSDENTLEENVEEVTVVDTEVVETDRTADNEQSDRQMPTSHLEDTEENADADAGTTNENTARSEEPEEDNA